MCVHVFVCVRVYVEFNEKTAYEFQAGGMVWWRENNSVPACYLSLINDWNGETV